MSATSISVHPLDVSAPPEDAVSSHSRQENRAAWIQLVLAQAPIAYRSALRITRNSADAQDIQQESLLRAISHHNQFAGHHDGSHKELRAWISRIAANAAIDGIRRRQEKRWQSLDEKIEETGRTLVDNLPSDEGNPEEYFFRRQMQRLLVEAVRQLAPELRKVCLLRDVLQYTTQEIAECLGISCLAVRLRLFRARRRLREKLSQSPHFQDKPSMSGFASHCAN